MLHRAAAREGHISVNTAKSPFFHPPFTGFVAADVSNTDYGVVFGVLLVASPHGTPRGVTSPVTNYQLTVYTARVHSAPVQYLCVYV